MQINAVRLQPTIFEIGSNASDNEPKQHDDDPSLNEQDSNVERRVREDRLEFLLAVKSEDR